MLDKGKLCLLFNFLPIVLDEYNFHTHIFFLHRHCFLSSLPLSGSSAFGAGGGIVFPGLGLASAVSADLHRASLSFMGLVDKGLRDIGSTSRAR